MSDFDDLEEIAAQNDIRVNRKTTPGKRGWGIGPKHGSPAREKPEPAPIAASKPAPLPETIMVAERGEVIATVRDSRDLVEAFRKIKDVLRLTNAHCDELAAMVEGHTDKVLGPSAQKEIGPLTFSKLCWLFAVKFEMVIDLEQMKVMAEHWEDRQRKRPLFPDGKVARISKKILEQAKPLIYRDAGRSGGLKRGHSLPAKLRSKIARKGGKSRMKTLTKEQLSVMNKKGWATRKRRAIEAQQLAAIALLSPPAECPPPECLLPSVG